MNKLMSRADLIAASVPLESFLGDRFADFPAMPAVKHEGPFSKRPEGRARRTERRQVRARKCEWINS